MKKILILEDEESVGNLERDILKREGFEVTLAEIGKEAIELLDTKSFDTVIIDLLMPGPVNGFDVIEWIKQYKKEMLNKVIISTGNCVRPTTREFIDKSGVGAVLIKPFRLDQLISTVKKVVKKYKKVVKK